MFWLRSLTCEFRSPFSSRSRSRFRLADLLPPSSSSFFCPPPSLPPTPSPLSSLKKVVSVVAGTKPYIFQHFRDGQLHLTLPGEEEKIIEGKFFDELTFISE